MEKSKKFRTLSLLILGALCSVLSFGCSCAKQVKPTGITIDTQEAAVYVGKSVDVKYTIAPVNSSNCKVDVVASDSTTVTLSQSSFDAAEGTVTITGNVVNVSGVTVTFKIDGTSLSASMVVKVKPDPVKLATPAGVVFNSQTNTIMFKSVPNTRKYVVKINDVDHEVTDPSTSTTEHFVQLPVFTTDVPLELNEVNTVSIKAVATEEAYADGDYSEAYKFLKYSPVTGITANEGVVTWENHALATMYQIKVNGAEQAVMASTNSYTLPATDSGEYLIQVAATAPGAPYIDENGVNVFASDYSEAFKITKLANCVLTLDNEALDENDVLGYSKVTFPAVLGASKYSVKITPQVGENATFDITDNFIEIDENFVLGTEYTIEVTPIGDATNTIAASTTSISFRRIPTIGEAQINHNILTIDGVATASKYAVIVKSDNDQKYIVSPLTTIDLAEELPVAGTYRVFVRPIGMIAENVTLANGDLFDTGLTITKIVNPIVSAINNDGTVHWNAVDNVISYSVFVNDEFENSVSTNSFKIDTTALEAGDHNVKIVAVGDGTNTISSGKANAVAYDFIKLPKVDVQTFSIVNDAVRFEGITEAYNYSIKFNNGNYRLIGKVEGQQEVPVSIDDVVNGTNEIYVMAMGDDVKIIASSPTKYTVTRLDAPTDLRIENGVLVWSGSTGNKYRIYTGDSDEYTESNEPNCDNVKGVSGELVVKVKALPTSGNYISSDFGTITVVKLPMIAEENIKVLSKGDDNEKSNYKLTWTAVENCTGYNLSIYTSAMAEPEVFTGYQSTELDLSEDYPAGTYTVKIVATGNSTGDGTAYINSSVSEIEFKKLGEPRGLNIVNNQLTWLDAVGDTPSSYMLGITYASRDEIFVVVQERAYSFDLSKFEDDETVKVRVRALGDNVGSVTGAYCNTFEFGRAKKVSNLMIKNGVVTWNPLVDVEATYLVYGKETTADDSTYTLMTTTNIVSLESTIQSTISGLEVNKQYSIYVVSCVSGLLYSDPSEVLKITKLPLVQNFKIEENTLKWDVVPNATRYVIVDGNNTKIETPNTNLSFDVFGYTANGDYSFRIYAVGTSENTTEGYVNSNTNMPLTVSILDAPNSVTISNNKLVITNSRKNLPVSYTIEFDNISDFSTNTHKIENVVLGAPEAGSTTSITEISLDNLTLMGAGQYMISVYCIGNGKELISSVSPFVIEAVEKLDKASVGVKVENGVLRWNALDSVLFDVYFNNNLVIRNTDKNVVDFDALKKDGIYTVEKDKNTVVNVVAKKEGSISSDKTTNFTIIKLPDVKNFGIKETPIDGTIGQSKYEFIWTPLEDYEGYKYQYENDRNSFSYEVVNVLGKDLTDKEIVGEDNPQVIGQELNLKTEDGIATSIEFNYGKTVYGLFKFNIYARGTKDSGTKAYGFINGDVCENPINVTILSPLSLDNYDRENNHINLINPNNDGGNRASYIKVAYENLHPADGENKYVVVDNIDSQATRFEVSYPTGFEPGQYKIWFGVVGSLNAGDYILNPAEQFAQKFELLDPVSEFYTTNGYINWSHPGGEGVTYEIYIDDTLVTYIILEEITPEDGGSTDNPAVLNDDGQLPDGGEPLPPDGGELPPEGEGGENPPTGEDGSDAPEGPQYKEVVVTSFKDPLEARMINDLILDTDIHRLQIRAVREQQEGSDFITANSQFMKDASENLVYLMTQKLPGVADPELKNRYLYWTKVANAAGYIIKSDDGNMADTFGESYDAERDGYWASGNMAGDTGVMLPTTIPAGQYTFYVVSEGSTTHDITESAYLTSSRLGSCLTEVLGQTSAIYTFNGNTTWDHVEGNDGYKIEIYKTKEIDIEPDDDCEVFETKDNFVNLDNYTKYPTGYYCVKVYTLGDGTEYLDANTGEPASITVYKPPKPDATGGKFKIRNGFLSWSVPLDNEYLLEMNNYRAYDADTYTALLLAAKGDQNADGTLSNNLEFFRNLEVTINGKVYVRQTVHKVELDTVAQELIYYYDFNFSVLRNPYTISVRFMGGSRGNTGGEIIANRGSGKYSTSILEGELPPEGGSETPPEEGGENAGASGFSQEVVYILNGNYSGEFTGHKLVPPQTPVADKELTGNKQIMVYMDNLYFSKVYVPDEGYAVDYMILADCTDPQKEDLEFYIDSTNRANYEQTMTPSSSANAYFKVPVADIGIETGYVYNLKVKAMGTKDSDLAGGQNYFTSNYDHSCEVEMLQKPSISVTEGDVTITTIQTAVSQEIKIWSTALGATYSFTESLPNDTKDPDKAAEVILLTPAGEVLVYDESGQLVVDPESPHAGFVAVVNGNFAYSFMENGFFPAGSYYVTSRAIGDGTEKISSLSAPVNETTGAATFVVHKYDRVDTVDLKGGKFRWEVVDFDNGSVTSTATDYRIEIFRKEWVQKEPSGEDDGEGEEGGLVYEPVSKEVKVLNISKLSSDNRICYFDLNPLIYPAQDEAGNRYEYAIKVSPVGTLDSTLVVGVQNYFVTGNPRMSGFYKRLLPPQDVKMVQGTLTWKEVESGFEYEVYCLNEELEEGVDFAYTIISDANYRYLTFVPKHEYENSVFTLRIRAIPGSETTQFLNGEFCVEILAKRLEQPLLRIENGVIKWNNTDLNFAIATGVKVKLVKVAEAGGTDTVIVDQEFDITDAVNSPEGYKLIGTDEEVPSGYYRVDVSYLGSNGYVTESDFDGPTDDEEEGAGDSENPDDPNNPSGDDNNPEEELPPEGGDEEGEEGEEDDKFADLGNYCWFNSLPASMEIFKLPTPKADLYIGTKDDAPVNYVAVEIIENARYYQFTVVKYNDSGEFVKSHTFTATDINTINSEDPYYAVYTDVDLGKTFVMFNVQAVADYDALDPNNPNPFGQKFSVYCNAYGEDRLFSSAQNKYSMTNNSNEVAIEVPLTPTGLVVDSSTGEIRWENASSKTKSRVRIYYNGSDTPVITDLPETVNTYKLQTMGAYSVSVLSFIDAANGIEMASAYCEPEAGECWIFGSGSGTAEDPYLISTSKHIINIDYYLDSHFKFISDIPMTETDLATYVKDFVIARKENTVFKGVIDGDGYTLSNVRFKFTEADQIALIRNIAAGATVKNLRVGINSGSGAYRVGKFGGITIVNNGSISNVQTLPCTMTGEGQDGELVYYPSNNQRIAGIAVENNGIIEDCVNNMLIRNSSTPTNMNTYVAGIVVTNKKNATVIRSGNNGELRGAQVGGIAVFNYSLITYCYSKGNLSAMGLASSTQAKAAGIVINNMDSTSEGQGEISTCYTIIDKIVVSGYINGQATQYGAGIVCDNNTQNANSVTNCYVALGTVSVNGGANDGKNNKFGTIVAADARVNIANYYTNDYYYVYGTININYGAHGDTTVPLTGVTQSATKSSFVTTLTTSLGSVYKADPNTINDGYPVFEWQLTPYIWK